MAKDDLASVLKAFDAIPKAARKGIEKAIDKGADEIVARAQYLAPEADGELKASIGKEMTSDLSATISTDNDAALYQEYGTANMDRNSFFWPAVNTLKKRVRGRVDRAISKAVRETFE